MSGGTKTLRPCETCGTQFWARSRAVAAGKGRFCGHRCCIESRRNRVVRTCEYCHREFLAFPAEIAVGKARFCSRSCNAKYRIGPKNHQWRGGKRLDRQSGYIFISIPSKRKIQEHRFLMEKHLGRKLLKGEIIHHKNGVKTDNRIENLMLTSPSDHAGLHKAMRPYQWSRNYEKCRLCNTTDHRHCGHGICRHCYYKWKRYG
jgi:hypothetical protein